MCIVSVIIPIYNASKTIDRCLESITNQTFQQMEIICCDDCSTDNSLKKLYSWQKVDNRIIVIHNERNMMASGARNRCINIAKGKYIALLDADDYCDANRISIQVDFLNEHSKYHFVSTGMFCFNENGIWGKRIIKNKSPIVKDLLYGIPHIHPSTMFRREIFNIIGDYSVYSKLPRIEDYQLFFDLYRKGYRGYNLEKCLYFYFENKECFLRRTYKDRIIESKVRYKGYKSLGMLPKGLIYVIKPLFIGLIPKIVMQKMQMKRFRL